jgi:hypothetical protein
MLAPTERGCSKSLTRDRRSRLSVRGLATVHAREGIMDKVRAKTKRNRGVSSDRIIADFKP